MKRCVWMTSVVVAVLPLVALALARPLARVTIEVVDEEGAPVPGALVYAWYDYEETRTGTSDANGRFTTQDRSLGTVVVGAKKEGYYGTGREVRLTVPDGVELGRRYPNSSHRVVLRRVVTPVPMYSALFSRSFPAETDVGIDLLKWDLVEPHGKGETTDMRVRIDRVNPRDDAHNDGATVSIVFPNPGDGMQRMDPSLIVTSSMFDGPRHAPEDGYIATWSETLGPTEGTVLVWHGKKLSVEPDGPFLSDTRFFLRIRSQTDESGAVTSAMYGSIAHDRGFDGITWGYTRKPRRSTVGFGFGYRVNPDGTTNLEFDYEQNLLLDVLPAWERSNLLKKN